MADTDREIPIETWEEIIHRIERDPSSDDAIAMLNSIDDAHLEHLAADAQHLFQRLVPLVCGWIREGGFPFAYCDVLAVRLTKIYELGMVREKAEATTAAFVLSCTHNRWFVMHKFFEMAGPSADSDLADRIAIELAAMGRDAVRNLDQILNQIHYGTDHLHEKIGTVLKELRTQYHTGDEP